MSGESITPCKRVRKYERGEMRTALQKLGGRALFDELPLFEHEQIIERIEPMKAMGGEHHQATLHDLDHNLLQFHLGLDIEMCRWLVEEDDPLAFVEHHPC